MTAYSPRVIPTHPPKTLDSPSVPCHICRVIHFCRFIMDLTYRAEKFASLAQTDLGQGLWAFLLEPSSIVRLETATGLERPAVEGIEEQLLERFGADVLEDRHMTKQVMESLGYEVQQQDVRLTSGAPFSRATRYARSGEVNYFVFRSIHNPRSVLVSLTKTPTLSDAPNWRFYKAYRGQLRACVALALPNIKEATEEMRRAGHYRHEIPRILRAA
jgi:hypothetical protein